MTRRRTALLLATAALLGAGAPPALADPAPLRTVDLAGTWDFRPDVGPATTIKVPGGGWVKQGHLLVKQATYEREIAVPDVAPGQVTELVLGAVNHQATVSVDGKEVATTTTSFTASVVDLSRAVTPGATHRLSVHVKGREAMVAPGRPATPTLPGVPTGALGSGYVVPDGAAWNEATPQGIFGAEAELRIHRPVRVTDAFVRPSVRRDELAVDVTVHNATGTAHVAHLDGRVASVGLRLPATTVRVPAGQRRTVTLGPVRWGEGPSSYWWPNVPYREDYRAVLHDLALDLDGEEAGSWRFGFREFEQRGTSYRLNGVRVNLRGDSLTGAMYDRIDHGGRGDAFHTHPGFLPPSKGNGGWPQAVRNFQRLNYNVVRVHQTPFSRYMFEVCDELGLMLIDESAIRGSESKQDFTVGRENMVAHLRDLVVRDRNHASVVRWSQSNEPDANANGEPAGFQRELYETIKRFDGTRPISIDVTSKTYEDIKEPDFTVYQHYVNEDGSIGGYTDDVHPREDRPFGRGEYVWPLDTTKLGFAWFATSVAQMRQKDAAEVRPYALAGAWASSIPGVRTTDFLTDSDKPPLYGEDNLPDPWANHQIQRVQRAFAPVAVLDRDYWSAQKRSDPLGRWPSVPVTVKAGGRVERTLVVLNDTFAGEQVDVRWEVRRGDAVVAAGEEALDVPLGERATLPLRFTAPAEPGELQVVLRASKPGEGELFDDAAQRLLVTP
jgi:hypothetical protein